MEPNLINALLYTPKNTVNQYQLLLQDFRSRQLNPIQTGLF